ncbi:MAG: hypothetical protein GXP24_01650 [Planctomycetes bacterium]|nr:hypothetical protein [Planctomycetota bacterium]
MLRYLLATLIAVLALPHRASADENQVLELRTYTLVDAAAEQKLDAYLEQALLPALTRQGLGPIGVFDQVESAAEGPIEVLLLVPGPSVEAVTGAAAKLASDQKYLAAGKEYLSTPADQPPLKRIRSELLLSFDCWPKVTVPKQKAEGQSRLFELRTYESPTENFGQLKVEMFNSGEVPIFLDCGIAPVFMGHALIGDKMPNLTYMTVYDNSAAVDTAWGNFVKHPDWQVLKEVKKYKGTVSKIYKSVWTPKSYSEL